MRILIEQAVNNLKLAEIEINRPSESVMAFTACKCTREAVIGLLNSFLAYNDEKIIIDNSISTILSKCAQIDPHFNSLDISCFLCGNEKQKNCASRYCLAVSNGNECYSTAAAVKEFVFPLRLAVHAGIAV